MAGKPKVAAKPVPAAKTTVVKQKRAPKKVLEPYVLEITILHSPDESDQDVLFASHGDCPADVDPDELEQYIADYFGDYDEDEDDDECYEDEDDE